MNFENVRISLTRVRYWYEIRDILVPILHGVKLTNCEIYGSIELHVLLSFSNKRLFSDEKLLLFFLLIFAQNIDCGYTLEAVLTSTHNLCFRAKIRKKCITL